jgi:hypothetical protein
LQTNGICVLTADQAQFRDAKKSDMGVSQLVRDGRGN